MPHGDTPQGRGTIPRESAGQIGRKSLPANPSGQLLILVIGTLLTCQRGFNVADLAEPHSLTFVATIGRKSSENDLGGAQVGLRIGETIEVRDFAPGIAQFLAIHLTVCNAHCLPQ